MDDYSRLQALQPYLFAATFVVMAVWESFRPLFAHPHRIQHIRRNLALAAVNASINLAMQGLVVGAAFMAEERGFGVLRWIGAGTLVNILAGVLVLDLGNYVVHRIKHAVPVLWRFHRVHHSDMHLDVTSSTRFHPGETLFTIAFQLSVVVLFGIELWALPLYFLMLTTVIQINHANVRVSMRADRLLRKVVVSPYMHKLHHSRNQVETDSNFSDVFPFWDKLFGTYRERARYDDIKLGLEEYVHSSQSVRSLLGMPFSPTPKPCIRENLLNT